MAVPTDRKYLESHEWHKADGTVVTIGITQFAADELTDITYVELPSVGDAVTAGEAFGEVESVKATGDLVAGVSGTVTAINEQLADDPGLVNTDPYEEGWMIRVEAEDLSAMDGLLDAAAYEAQLG